MTAEAQLQRAQEERKRGRPRLMSDHELLDRVRDLAARGALFRVHRTHGGLYARARRRFGSWARAVLAAGIDYRQIVTRAREQAMASRRRRPMNGSNASTN